MFFALSLFMAWQASAQRAPGVPARPNLGVMAELPAAPAPASAGEPAPSPLPSGTDRRPRRPPSARRRPRRIGTLSQPLRHATGAAPAETPLRQPAEPTARRLIGWYNLHASAR